MTQPQTGFGTPYQPPAHGTPYQQPNQPYGAQPGQPHQPYTPQHRPYNNQAPQHPNTNYPRQGYQDTGRLLRDGWTCFWISIVAGICCPAISLGLSIVAIVKGNEAKKQGDSTGSTLQTAAIVLLVLQIVGWVFFAYNFR